tara:strand:+ start:2177 stop:2350 length:174 start_codon:yes stop_codon:yes gene_type:complete
MTAINIRRHKGKDYCWIDVTGTDADGSEFCLTMFLNDPDLKIDIPQNLVQPAKETKL